MVVPGVNAREVDVDDVTIGGGRVEGGVDGVSDGLVDLEKGSLGGGARGWVGE